MVLHKTIIIKQLHKTKHMNTKILFILGLLISGVLRGGISAQNARPYDLIINEIMPDPAPPVGLPNAEYIEIFNRSNQDIDLQGFKLVNGTVITELNRFLLKSGKYVTIYTRKNGVDFGIFGDTLPVARLGTLSNPNDTFYLLSRDSVVIDATAYDLTFYQNSNKAEGGWSLERVFSEQPCQPFAANWLASNDLRGGTPSQPNSVLRNEIDRTAPQLLSIFPLNEKIIRVQFDKSLDRNINIFQYEIFQNSLKIAPRSLKILPPFFTAIDITLSENLLPQKKYLLKTAANIADCMGNPSAKMDSLFFQLPEKAARNDLIINEILVDPEIGGGRYIELFNRSEKAINLATLRIADLTRGDVQAIKIPFLVMPQTFVVLTTNILHIQKRYNCFFCQKNLLKNNLPTWDAASGNATLLSYEGNRVMVIDSFQYDKKFHNPLLANTKGIALERIATNAPTLSMDNWHSAAASERYGTPTRMNSVARKIENTPPSVTADFDEHFRFDSPTFSPDEDSFEDILLLHYQLPSLGWSATIRIFDSNGRLVKNFVNNELLANEGFWKWGGETNEGNRASVGIYVWLIELQQISTGKRHFVRKTCVLSTKF